LLYTPFSYPKPVPLAYQHPISFLDPSLTNSNSFLYSCGPIIWYLNPKKDLGMKISTLPPVHHTETNDVPDALKKKVLTILFICLAAIALADSVYLVSELSTSKPVPSVYVYR